MTAKRSDYRKRQKKSLLNKVKSAFNDNNATEEVNVNPDFQRDASERRRPLEGDGQEFYQAQQSIDKEQLKEQKSLKLKKRLNSAILIVFVLIILVLLALFHL
ncbi:hypothetical protein KQ229_00145 [Lactobacillus helveticus]|uniref:Uncharacterized protein n=3 Tax=Lactobacillus helveticus TaxID=1587 RepID=A0A0D5MJE8_LACHE|nr:hypothetical protein [Lactobacillus helveticus]AGQ23362.1 hypothetical protein lhe_0837 [Lactobacillus helveticus CNRZ32]AJY61703.1 hypothetical protein HUO_07700 [Lactobacillus helveticus]ANZ55201.1 hypothetical protein BCM45_00770 [Lactobacillus helveticus]AQY53303.1 hypothetical protein BCM44_03955 [Lactobacillus helveticus]AUI74517.1 hypothetical protein Lh8105_06870 [Lactobacillus helveticus]